MGRLRVGWLLVLAGCGRLGFEVGGDGALDPVPDAGFSCATAADGTPCDDRNICTPSSACQAGACVPATPAGSCEVAHSLDDYSETQGELGWYYGSWDITDDSDGIYEPGDLQLSVDFSGLWRPADWQPDPDPHFTWAYLAAWGGHPGSYPIERASVRRWVSTVQGDAIARVTHSKSDAHGGDGTRAILVVDGVQRFTHDIAGTDGVGYVEAVPIRLHVGSTVDLLLHFIGDDASDTSNLTLDVISR